MWEEFVQAIQTFLTDKANLDSPTKKGRKDKPHVIPYCRFTKLIICHLGIIHNIHQRLASLFHLAEQDLRLRNLKFVSKGEADEVFGMPIPNELISNNIRNAPYYSAYLEMVAKHDQKVAAEKEGKKKEASTKQPKPKPVIEKSSKPAPAPKPKVTKEKPSKTSTAKPPKSKAAEACQRKESFQAQSQAHVGGVAIREPVAEATRPLPVRISTTEQFILQRRTPIAKEASTGPSAQPLDDTSANIVHDSSSPADAETGARSDKMSSGGDTEARSDPSENHESQPLPEQAHMDEDQAGPDPGISHVALSGPDPELTHDEFIVDLYPKVQESLKFPADEHVLLQDPLSSTRTLSSMKNLGDAYAIGDQFINDKYTDDESGKLNVEAEVVSMVTVLIYQASSLVPPLSTPKKLSDLEQTNKNLDNTTQNLRSRVYTLELRDLPHKIDEAVHENVKEAVQIALQAPLRERFRDLSEEDMKEMLYQRMFGNGT
ncbi:hypothetical protein Tco_1134209 [Tanacetum coccineum]